MDWLFTAENMATAIVIVGFGLFTATMCLFARSNPSHGAGPGLPAKKAERSAGPAGANK